MKSGNILRVIPKVAILYFVNWKFRLLLLNYPILVTRKSNCDLCVRKIGGGGSHVIISGLISIRFRHHIRLVYSSLCDQYWIPFSIQKIEVISKPVRSVTPWWKYSTQPFLIDGILVISDVVWFEKVPAVPPQRTQDSILLCSRLYEAPTCPCPIHIPLIW